jgi:hypothetical protein
MGGLQACGEAAFETVREAVSESDLVTLVGELSTAIPSGGSCPNATFNAWGETYNIMESGCELVDEVTPILSVCFLIGWSWVGLRILLKTF